MINDQTYKYDVIDYCNTDEIKRYKIWVYDVPDMLSVFYDKLPNTKQIWFEFYAFSQYYWKIMQDECIFEMNGDLFYNYEKLKLFMLNYLLCNTNIPNVIIERKKDGTLTDKSFQSVISIHPRILRVLFDVVEFFPKTFSKKEQKLLEKQCHQLFGKGESVSSPHKSITQYCNLIAFWDKFGMNYHDIMKLPYQVFYSLKKIMALDNEYKSQSINKKSSKGVGF